MNYFPCYAAPTIINSPYLATLHSLSVLACLPFALDRDLPAVVLSLLLAFGIPFPFDQDKTSLTPLHSLLLYRSS